MKILIGWLAVAAVLLLILFVLRRIGGVFLGRRCSEMPAHDDIADVAEDIAAASRVSAALSGAAAFFVAPAGVLAVAAAIGLAPKPLIVTLLPFLVVFAAGAAALSAAAKLYVKSQRKK